MGQHKISVNWQRTSDDFTVKSFNRDHAWQVEGGTSVAASAPAEYLGDPSRVSPESGFAASLSACHMLTFLAAAANKGFVVEQYVDEAVGHTGRNEQGRTAMTKVELNPVIRFSPDSKPSQEDFDKLHEHAHRQCFIANSVTTEIVVKPTLEG